MKVKTTELRTLAQKILFSYDYTSQETKVILEILMYAQLRGNNQGLVKLLNDSFRKNPNAKQWRISKNTPLSTLINGNQSPAMFVMKEVLERTLKKAKKHGFAIVGTYNTSSSTGAIGYYANEIAKRGFIGFVFAGSPPTVATHGSYQPLFGTNPLAIGLPTNKEPVVLDMATAAIPYYGLVEAKIAGRKIPTNTAYDKTGNVTTNPALALAGAIMTFDRSYKSAGLAMIVEALTGPLVNASFTGIGNLENWGNMILILDPSLLTDKKTFERNVSRMVARIKNSKKLSGVDEIYVPGERGNRLAKTALRLGLTEIDEHLYNHLKKLAT